MYVCMTEKQHAFVKCHLFAWKPSRMSNISKSYNKRIFVGISVFVFISTIIYFIGSKVFFLVGIIIQKVFNTYLSSLFMIVDIL